MTSATASLLAPDSGHPAPLRLRAHLPGVVVLLVLALITVVGAAVVYDWVADGQRLAAVDVPVLEWFSQHRAPGVTEALVVLSIIGSTTVLTPLLALFIGMLCWHRKTFWPLVVLLATAACSVLTTVLLKNALERPRPPYEHAIPPYETSGSFPSGHTLNSTTLCLVLIYLVLRWATATWVRRVLVIVAILYPLLMAFSRVYMGAHWVTDVVAGWLIGAAWAAVIISVDRLLLLRRPERVTQAPRTSPMNAE